MTIAESDAGSLAYENFEQDKRVPRSSLKKQDRGSLYKKRESAAGRKDSIQLSFDQSSRRLSKISSNNESEGMEDVGITVLPDNFAS